MKLWQKNTVGLILGIIMGVTNPEYVSYVKPVGDVFLKLIKMIINPMIFFSLVAGITSTSDSGSLGRVGIKATVAFLVTTFFAVLFGLGVSLLFKPGVGIDGGFNLLGSTNIEVKEFSGIDILMKVIPSNAMAVLAGDEILPVVFLALFTGVTLNKMGSSVYQVKSLLQALSKVVLKMISIIIQMSPYGAFALTAWVIGTEGVNALFHLSKLFLCVFFAMFLQYLIFGLLILVFCRISPMPFYKKSLPYQLLAFSTSSSKATLSTTMDICKRELGVSDSSTSFILPLGASINMDGLAINLGLTAVFFAQLYGVDLSLYDYVKIVITATIGSIGGAGIPGASLIMLPMVLSSVNLPTEGVAIIAGIDRILDMLRTTINITGDATITLIVDHSEGTLDKEKYFS